MSVESTTLTWKTSVSRNLVPNTVMPLVSMEARSLLGRGLVSFLLQSRTMVTVFFSTLMATRCHLAKGHRKEGREMKQSGSPDVPRKEYLQIGTLIIDKALAAVGIYRGHT